MLSFPDIALEQSIRYAVNVWGRDLAPADVASLSFLSVTDFDTGDLRGIECLPNLGSLILTGTGFSDLAQLSAAPSLISLQLFGTRAVDLAPVAATRLQFLSISESPVPDLSALLQSSTLKTLSANGEIDCPAQLSTIQELTRRGVKVSTNCASHCGFAWSGNDVAVAVSTNLRSACALLSDGRVKCWSSWLSGQWIFSGPELVTGLSDVVQLAGASSAVTAQGTIASWVPPTSTGVGRNTPQFKPDISDATAVTRPFFSTCILRRDKSVWCWGFNKWGTLGNGDPSIEQSDIPLKTAGLPNIAAIDSGGGAHVCALDEAGNLYCWGDNSAGQVSANSPQWVFTPVHIPLQSPVRQMGLGGYGTCVLLADDSVQCWGAGFGLPSSKIKGLCKPVALAAGGESPYCALLESGRVQCWSNAPNLAALGTKAPPDATTAVDLPGLDSVKQLAMYGAGGCALLNSGSVRCFGSYLPFGGTPPDCVPGFIPTTSANAGSDCDIDGATYASGTVDPQNSCQTCRPEISNLAWTARYNGTDCAAASICVDGSCTRACQIGAIPYLAGAVNPDDPCQTCAPEVSTTNWSNVPSSTCTLPASADAG